MAGYVETDLSQGVRAECGKAASTAELEDTDIRRESQFILNRIAEMIPVKTLRYITSIASTSDYDVNASTVNVRKVFQWDDVDSNLMVLGGYKANEAGRDELYNFPSLWAIEQFRRLRGMPKIRFEFHPVQRKLRIIPTPSQTGDKYYYISVEHALWTMATLPDEFKELVLLGTTWKCLEIILLKRSNLGGVLRDGGFVDFPAISMKGYIEQKKADYEELLKRKAMLYCL
jgi:hypothetical protein